MISHKTRRIGINLCSRIDDFKYESQFYKSILKFSSVEKCKTQLNFQLQLHFTLAHKVIHFFRVFLHQSHGCYICMKTSKYVNYFLFCPVNELLILDFTHTMLWNNFFLFSLKIYRIIQFSWFHDTFLIEKMHLIFFFFFFKMKLPKIKVKNLVRHSRNISLPCNTK